MQQNSFETDHASKPCLFQIILAQEQSSLMSLSRSLKCKIQRNMYKHENIEISAYFKIK